MTASGKVIVTCALTGAADTPKKNPAVPVTPEQIADSALDAARAGAAVVHIHVRDPQTTRPSLDLELYREVVERIQAINEDVVINLTTGPGQRFDPGDPDPRVAGPATNLTTPDIRVRHILALRPELCSLDVATMASGGAYGGTVMMNTPKTLSRMASLIREAGTKPELEVFDAGHIRMARYLIGEGYIENPPFFQLCLGIEWGAPADPAAVDYLVRLLPENAIWAAFGIGRTEFPIVAQAVIAGGHVRVGLEDNLYLGRGELAPSNAALVERAVQIVELVGGSVASPDEARELLSLPRRSAAPAIATPS